LQEHTPVLTITRFHRPAVVPPGQRRPSGGRRRDHAALPHGCGRGDASKSSSTGLAGGGSSVVDHRRSKALEVILLRCSS